MAYIKLAEDNTLAEGTNTFKIVGVDDLDYDDFGRLSVDMVTKNGARHRETFRFIRSDGSANEITADIWGKFARAALNDRTRADINTAELIGHYVTADVEGRTYVKRDGSEGHAFNLKRFKPAPAGFGPEVAEFDMGDFLDE